MRPGFGDIDGRRLFECRYGPPGALHRVLVVHSLFEEMNKSRAVVARIARAVGAAGVETLVVDPFGTGDSAGDLDDADYATWVSDLGAIAERFRPDAILAIRAGALMVSEALAARDGLCPLSRLVLVNPVPSGDTFLGQFLRLRIAANKFAGIAETQDDLMARLRAGETVEVAGYPLTRRVSDGLAAARVVPPSAGKVDRIEVVEVGPSPRTSPSRPMGAIVDAAREAGTECGWSAVVDERFWATTELARAEAVVAHLTAMLEPRA